MHVILSKMVQGLLPASSESRLPIGIDLKSDNATRDVLLTTIRTILSRGCINADEVIKMDYLLNVGGAAWYAEHLVRVRYETFYPYLLPCCTVWWSGCFLIKILSEKNTVLWWLSYEQIFSYMTSWDVHCSRK